MSTEPATDAQIRKLFALLHSLDIDPLEWKAGRGLRLSQLSKSQCSALIDELEELRQKRSRPAEEITVEGIAKVMELAFNSARTITSDLTDVSDLTKAEIANSLALAIFQQYWKEVKYLHEKASVALH